MPKEKAPTGGRKLLSGEEFLEMPDLVSCELVRGTIVHAQPSGFLHSDLAASFFRVLDSHVRPRRSGKVVIGEVGIYTEWEPDTVRGADVAYISNERLARVKDPRKFLEVPPGAGGRRSSRPGSPGRGCGGSSRSTLPAA